MACKKVSIPPDSLFAVKRLRSVVNRHFVELGSIPFRLKASQKIHCQTLCDIKTCEKGLLYGVPGKEIVLSKKNTFKILKLILDYLVNIERILLDKIPHNVAYAALRAVRVKVLTAFHLDTGSLTLGCPRSVRNVENNTIESYLRDQNVSNVDFVIYPNLFTYATEEALAATYYEHRYGKAYIAYTKCEEINADDNDQLPVNTYTPATPGGPSFIPTKPVSEELIEENMVISSTQTDEL